MLSKQSTKRNSKKEKHIMMKQNQELTIIILEQVFSIEAHSLPSFLFLLNQIPVSFVSHFFQNPHALVFSLTPLYLSFALFFSFSLFSSSLPTTLLLHVQQKKSLSQPPPWYGGCLFFHTSHATRSLVEVVPHPTLQRWCFAILLFLTKRPSSPGVVRRR